MNDKKEIENYIKNNKIDLDSLVDDYTPYLRTVIQNMVNNNLSEENSDEYYDEGKKWPIYKEDDEDYDNIILQSFDLSLRKWVIQKIKISQTNSYQNK